MSRYRLKLILATILTLAAFSMPTTAQEPTPEVVAPVGDITVEDGATLNISPPDAPMDDPDAPEAPVSETPEPAFEALLTMAASVAFAVEWIKKGFLSRWLDNSGFGDEAKAAVIQAVAALLALALVFATEADLNVLAVLGIYPDAPPLLAKFITAFAVSGGNMVLWAAYRFFKGGTLPGAARVPR